MSDSMRQSLDRRLTLSVLVTTLIVLSLSFSGLAWLDYQRAKDSIVARVDTLATVTAVNAGVALDQQSSAQARQILEGLSREPRVIAAVISDYCGEEFFRYVAPQAQFRGEASTEVGQTFHARHLDLVRPIESKGETVGTILIRWDTGELSARLTQMGFLVLGVIVALVLVGIPYSQWVRRTVTRPLNDLVGHSKSIAAGTPRLSQTQAGLWRIPFCTSLARPCVSGHCTCPHGCRKMRAWRTSTAS